MVRMLLWTAKSYSKAAFYSRVGWTSVLQYCKQGKLVKKIKRFYLVAAGLLVPSAVLSEQGLLLASVIALPIPAH